MVFVEKLQILMPGYSLATDHITLLASDAVWLQGDNGAGKSTLLKSLAGIYQVHSKKQHCLGVNLKNNSINYKKNIVYVSAQCNAYQHFTVAETLAFCAKFYPQWQGHSLLPLADSLDLPLNKTVKSLSSGMAAKLNFLVAACSGVNVYLIDELLAPMDANAKHIIVSFFTKQLNSGSALIYCSHNQNPLTQLTQQKWLISQGKLNTNVKFDEVMAC